MLAAVLAQVLAHDQHCHLPKDISACSLWAAGGMALLCAQVDWDVVWLLGRWCSDKILHCARVQAEAAMCHFTRKMLSVGAFSLLPDQDVPSHWHHISPTSSNKSGGTLPPKLNWPTRPARGIGT
jgi:hypothetical protein